MPFSTPMLDDQAGDGEPKPLGARLKALREARGQSIADVVEATNIPTDKIEAIENGTIAGSAPTAYARGFVRLYAEHLETDVEAVMADFDRLSRPEHGKLYLRGLGPMSHKDYRPGRRHDSRRGVRVVLLVLLVLAALALAYYGWERLGRWLQSMEEQPPQTPAGATNEGTGAEGATGDNTGTGIDKPAFALTIVALENAPYKVEADGVLTEAEQILPKGKDLTAEAYKSLRITLREPAKVRVLENGADIEQDLGTEPVVLIYDKGGLRIEPADGGPEDELPAGDPTGPGPDNDTPETR